MGADGKPLVDTFPEILTLEHLLECDPAVQPDDILEAHRLEPLPVVTHSGFFGIEDPERLFLIGLGMLHDLLVVEMGTCRGATARVADHGREITDDQNGLMAELLKLSQFRKADRVTKVDVGRSRIDSKLHPERATQS